MPAGSDMNVPLAQVGAGIPLQPVVMSMVRQLFPCNPLEVRGGAEIHLQPVEDPRPGGCLMKEALTP